MNNIKLNNEIKFEFPIGFIDFHKNKAFNFQLNRFYSFGFADYDDLDEIAKKTQNVNDWKEQFLRMAK